MTLGVPVCILITWTIVGQSSGAQFSSVASLYDYLSGRSYKYIRPETDLQNPTKLNFSFHLSNLQALDENAGLFSVAGYFEITWIDHHLVWDPALYGGKHDIRLPKTALWTPHILVGNPYSKVKVVDLKDSTVKVYADGSTQWVPADSYQAACDSDVTYYPFDTQTCTIEIVPWQFWTNEIEIGITSNTTSVTYFSPNPLWDYISSRVYNKTTEVIVEMTFRRRPAFFMVNIMFPIILLGALNLFVFVLPADSGERVGFSITLLLSIAVFMTVIADSLPSTSSPRLSIVCTKLVSDFGISGLVVLCTIFGLVFHHRDESVPVTPFWKKLLKIKQLCLKCRKNENYGNGKDGDTEDKLSSAVVNGADTPTWKDVRSFIDRFCLIFFAVVFVVSNLAFFLDIVVGIK